MKIKIDDVTHPTVIAFVEEHMRNLNLLSPPESNHYLDLEALRKPDVTFWSVWEGEEVIGCGALKELNAMSGEVKSMRTSSSHLRKGIGRQILQSIIDKAHERGYQNLYLETGSMEAFYPAQKLYKSFGFNYCQPFADYVEDPNCVFMRKIL
ncbi:MAG: GNAT family N-acetyltransferase [Bacillota bacterium]|jgi:putative acetyltransferase|uniref:GNAT family N-acetyltransferase n=1 Tax=Bacillus sp. RO2 TaxID=2723913 RepID=UPI00145FA5D9|nr:GNAT family N-acetyltransferase [Bacillus sp. RO2]MEA3322500.1 GNAT family N-acetyltransferase [Bacillota bacterium]NMH74176.1 GNAT family N-acetyltransferase [Bacillus sp. RO2]